MYYQNDIKNGFLINSKDAQFYAHIFKHSKHLEEELGKDLHSFNSDELEQLFKCFDMKKTSSAYRFNRAITKYRDWCIGRGLQVDLHESYRVDSQLELGNRLFGSPEDLDRFLDLALDNQNINTTDLIYRAVAWLSFGGLPIEEIVELKRDGVNLKDNHVSTGSSKGIIYPQARSTIKKMCELNHFFYINQNYKEKGMIVRNRLESEYLLRGVRSEKQSLNTLITSSHKILRSKSDHDHQSATTYKNIELSGYFYRAYEHELQGFDFGVEMVLKEYARKGLQKRIGLEDPNFERKLNRKLNDFVKNYNVWKETFYPRGGTAD